MSLKDKMNEKMEGMTIFMENLIIIHEGLL